LSGDSSKKGGLTMTLYQLRQFIVLAEEKHFGHAAKRLGIEQPPLSQSIQRLEKSVGVQLFDRTNRSVELTGAGKAFLREVLQALSHIEAGVLTAQHVMDGMVGQLKVACNTPAGYDLVPRILRTFRGKKPNVELSLIEMDTSEQVDAIMDGRVDIGFLRCRTFENDHIHTECLMQERIVAVLPRDHHLAKSKTLCLHDLRNEPFVMPPHRLGPIFSGPSFHSHILGACQEAGFTPKISQDANLLQTVISLVAAGIGVALVPNSLRKMRRTDLVYKDLGDRSDLMYVNLGMAWSKHNQSPILPALIEVTRIVTQNISKSSFQFPTIDGVVTSTIDEDYSRTIP